MKGAIFDIDGTILDSMTIFHKITEKFFLGYGKTFTPELTKEINDMRLEDSAPHLIEIWNLDITPEFVLETVKKKFEEEYKTRIAPKPYVGEYIKKLHDDGIKIAAATSGYYELCSHALKRCGLLEYIDAFAFSHEVGCPKSNPNIYLLAAERIGQKPEDCMVYEDILIGIQGAKKGGFRTCAIKDETNLYDTEMLKNESDIYISSWKELL